MKKESYLIRYSKVIFKIGKYKCCLSFIGLLIVTGVDILLPQILAKIVDDGIGQKNNQILLTLSLIYLILLLVSKSDIFILDNYYEKLKLKISTFYKNDLLKRLSMAKGNYLSYLETGNVLHIIDSDLSNIEEFGVDMIFDAITNLLTFLFVFYILIQNDMKLLFPVIGIQIMLFCINYFMTKKISSNIKHVRDIVGEQSNLEEQYISNLKSIILTDSADFFRKLIGKKQREFVKQSQKTNLLLSGQKELVIVLNEFSTIITYLIGGCLIIDSSMSMGELLAFVKYVSMLVGPCMYFVNFNIKIHQVNISLKNLYSEMDKIECQLEQCQNGIELKEIRNIEFCDVSFSYDKKKVFNGLNFTIRNGKIYGIVGESGCGKSTLGNLLYRLWEPDEGRILINGKDIKEFCLDSVRKRICIVCQDALLFDGSIIENIKMDNENISEGKIIEICRNVKLLSTIKEKGGKNIGERGNNLSGGQRQRIAIARALTKKCDVFILDEATAALDNKSQNIILKNIKLYLRDKTVIVIAHRIEAIKELENIIVMKDGDVVERGSHQELIKMKGNYFNILEGII